MSGIFPVVGVSFVPEYPQNVFDLLPLPEEAIEVCLVREPDNKFDPNAIRVDVRVNQGEAKKFGYIAATVAKDWSPLVDTGAVELVPHIAAITTHPKHPDRPGLSVHVEVRNLA